MNVRMFGSLVALCVFVLSCSNGTTDSGDSSAPSTDSDSQSETDSATPPAAPVENGGEVVAEKRYELRGFAAGVAAGNYEPEDGSMIMADVLQMDDGTYRMYYGQRAPLPIGENIRVATSPDGESWTPADDDLALAGAKDDADVTRIMGGPSVVRLPDGGYRMFVRCSPKPGSSGPDYHIRSAISKNGLKFDDESPRIKNQTMDPTSPWLTVGHGRFYALDDGTWAAIVTVEPNKGSPADLALFTSTDTTNWTYQRILYEDYHDPVVIRSGSDFLMIASYKTEYAAMMTSTDGVTWPAQVTKLEFFEMGATEPLANEDEVADFGAMFRPDGQFVILANFPSRSSIAVFMEAKDGG